MTSRTKRFAIVFAALVGVASVIGVAAWRQIAISMAPKKRPTPSRSAAAITADSVFWQTLHSGAYHQLPHAIEVLTRAYVATPGDAVTASKSAQDMEADMAISSAPRDYRTLIAAASLIAGPLLMAIGDLLHPEERMAPAEQIAILVDHASRWYTAHLLLFVGMMLFIPGLLALSGLTEA